MRRILLVLTVALVMAAMVVVTAAPAFAAPPEQQVACVKGPATAIGSSNEPQRFGLLGKFQTEFKPLGFDCTRTVTPNPGPPS